MNMRREQNVMKPPFYGSESCQGGPYRMAVGQAAGDSGSSRLLPWPGYPVLGSSDDQAPVAMENGWRDNKFPNASAFEFRDPCRSSQAPGGVWAVPLQAVKS